MKIKEMNTARALVELPYADVVNLHNLLYYYTEPNVPTPSITEAEGKKLKRELAILHNLMHSGEIDAFTIEHNYEITTTCPNDCAGNKETATWEGVDGVSGPRCSCCGHTMKNYDDWTKFCPNCGRLMCNGGTESGDCDAE